jgi:hypothetical protein
MDMKDGRRPPKKNAADRISLKNAVPQVAYILGIPYEQALECRDEIFSSRELANKIINVAVFYAYFAIAVIQKAPPAARAALKIED